jgi:hypothetical protein
MEPAAGDPVYDELIVKFWPQWSQPLGGWMT